MAISLTTGLCLRDGKVEWTILRRGKTALEVVAHREEALPTAENLEAALAAFLKPQADAFKGYVCLALPAAKALLRVCELPAIDLEELRGMVELQVDKFSPFPVEQMAISFEILHQREQASLVLMVATPNQVIQELGAGVLKAGLLPQRVDVDVMGRWQALHAREVVPENGTRVFVLLESGGTEIVVSQDGQPIIFRTLSAITAVDRVDFLEEICQEVDLTLTGLETEWGGATQLTFSIWCSRDVPADDVAQKLREIGGVPVEVSALEDLPPVSEGLARRTAAGEDKLFNLAPGEWHRTEQTRHARKTMLVATAVFLALWLSAIAGFLFALNHQRRQLAILEDEVKQLEGPAAEVKALRGKLSTFDQYADRTYSALECLREVSDGLPDGITLSSFTYDKGNMVSLAGEAQSADLVATLKMAMDESPIFTSVRDDGITTRNTPEGARTQFRLTLFLPGEETP